MIETDSIRYKIQTLFFEVASRSMQLGGGIETVEKAELDAEEMTDSLYELLASEGYEIAPVRETVPAGHYHG